MPIVDKALQGKVALVTGASRGIGRAIAVALGRRGAKVIINFASREDAAREAAKEVEAAGGQSAIAGFDVANQNDGVIKSSNHDGDKARKGSRT